MSVETADVEAIHQRLQRATAMVSSLCRPRGTEGAREWIMSIPARPDHDPDLVIDASLRDVRHLLAENEILRTEIVRLREALGNISRMRTFPDHKTNTFTLVIAHELAERALATATDADSESDL